jgi:mycofactocin precursor
MAAEWRRGLVQVGAALEPLLGPPTVRSQANLGRTRSIVRTDSMARNTEELMSLLEDPEVIDTEELADDDIDDLLVEEVSIDGMCGVY